MPTRILREGIISSERIDQLDYPSEVFYRRLMSKVDDHGLYDARPSILRAALYPLRTDRVREADISRWLAACQMAGLIVLYLTHDGKQYLKMLDTNWQIRSEPKFPLPDDGQLITPDNNCLQPCTNTETYTETKTKTYTKTFIVPTASEVSEYAKSIGFALNGNSFVDWYESKGWMIGKNKMKDWKAAVRTWKLKQDGGVNAKTTSAVTGTPGKYDAIEG